MIVKSDADYVDVIHTDTDVLGIRMRLGDADYYPNKGEDQPVLDFCGGRSAIKEAVGDYCDHRAAVYYFESSLLGTHFWSKCCEGKWVCKDDCGSYMGIQSTKNASGRWYYTLVEPLWPYALWQEPGH